MLLKNKIVLITGASSGIGEAAAFSFAAQGAKLILTARRKERLEKLSEKLQRDFETESLISQFDIRNQAAVEKFLDALPEEWRNIDILINNAGLSRGMNKLQDGLISDWEEMIDTNIKGLLYITRAVLPGMIERNSGHIVNISSISGHKVYTAGNVYCATKHAVRALCESLRLDVFGTKIRVSCVSPGSALTEFSIVRYHGDKQKADDFYKGFQPLSAEDIAETIMFCCSRPPHVNIDDIIIMPQAQARVDLIYREQ